MASGLPSREEPSPIPSSRTSCSRRPISSSSPPHPLHPSFPLPFPPRQLPFQKWQPGSCCWPESGCSASLHDGADTGVSRPAADAWPSPPSLSFRHVVGRDDEGDPASTRYPLV